MKNYSLKLLRKYENNNKIFFLEYISPPRSVTLAIVQICYICNVVHLYSPYTDLPLGNSWSAIFFFFFKMRYTHMQYNFQISGPIYRHITQVLCHTVLIDSFLS